MQNTTRYMQILNYYTDIIDSGKMSEGEQMPTENNICDLFNVSRITVRKALDALCQNGYIYKIQGKGSFVSHKETGMQLNHLYGFSDEMRMMGREPSTRLISQRITSPSDKVMNGLMLNSGQKVYVVERLRCADTIPMALEVVHLPFHRFPGIENQDITKSLYKLLSEQYGCERSRAEQGIRADLADHHAAKELEMKTGMAVLHITRVTFDRNGLPFEYVESTYRGDKYVFNVSLGV